MLTGMSFSMLLAGEEIPKSDPCLTCHCMENGEEICMSMACALCPEGVEVQHDPNECCPKCLICERSGQLFPVGMYMDITVQSPYKASLGV